MTALPLLLVGSLLAGIGWADVGGRIPGSSISFCLLAGIVVSGLLVGRPVGRGLAGSGGRSRPARTPVAGGGPVRRILALWLAMACLFVSGFDRFARIRQGAMQDARRAERALGEGVRIAEAWIVGRRSDSRGDEVELGHVREVDGGSPLPARLVLRLPRVTPTPTAAASGPRMVGGSPSTRAGAGLWPGERVRLGLLVSPIRRRRNPGDSDRDRAAVREGLVARARLLKPGWVLRLSGAGASWPLPGTGMRGARASWRREVANRLGRSGPGSALVRALVLGDRSEVSAATRAGFRALGLSHLLAVSGLHVGLVAVLAAWMPLRVSAWRPRRRCRSGWPFDRTLAVAASAATIYAWSTDAGVSVVRAGTLFCLFAVFRSCLRRVTPGDALAWVAIGVVWSDPAALFDLGAQLSFGACAALVAGGCWRRAGPDVRHPPRDRGRWADLQEASLETLRASLAVSVGTAPILLHQRLALVPLAPLFNVPAIPWMAMVVLPASLFAAAASAVLDPWMVSILVLPAEIFARGVVHVASWLPHLAGPALLGGPMLILVAGLAILAVRRGRWFQAAFAWGVIAFGGAPPGLAPDVVGSPPRVVYFDAGQGDAALVEGRGATMLIDGGPGPPDGSGGAGLVRALRALDVAAIDVFVVTHADLDHRGGAERVIGALVVGELWLPASAEGDPTWARLLRTARDRGTRIRWVDSRTRVRLQGDVDARVLWPPPGLASASRNDASTVLRIEAGGMTFLFAADIGAEVERTLLRTGVPLAADVLKVAHHASRTGSTRSFLEAVAPTISVVSAPCDAMRGLPNEGTLARIEATSGSLWWTGRDGAIFVFRASDGRLVAKGFGSPRRCG